MNQAEALPLIVRAKGLMEEQDSVGSTKAGWLMMAALLIEAWDIYSMAFIVVFLKEIYPDDIALIGFAAASTQLGAAFGSLFGGWLTDRFGRRRIFLLSMFVFAAFAILQGLAPSILWLAIIRFLGGFPVGSDVANGFTFMMEVLPKARREIMANRWQFFFAIGTIVAVVMVTVLQATGLGHDWLWRIVLMVPALPAIILLVLRKDLPETPAWLVERGEFPAAKKAAEELYGDLIDFLPDENVTISRPRLADSIRDVWQDSKRRRASIFGVVAELTAAAEFFSFSFYIPLILASVALTSALGNSLFTIGVNIVAAVSAFVGPLALSRLGHRGLTRWGTGLTVLGLVLAASGVFTSQILLIVAGAAIMLWGHYWAAESGMTVIAVVSRPRYRGALSGFAYMGNKVVGFIVTFTFPVLFTALGIGWAALITAIFPAITWAVATWVLPEVFGHAETSQSDEDLRRALSVPSS